MIPTWQELLYPLGFLSSICFASRMFYQWLRSEKSGKSLVTPTFWRISLIGNVLLLVHALIQRQFHIFIIQCCNATISWRNLNLMKPLSSQYTTRQTIALLSSILLGMSSLFFLQGYLTEEPIWFRIPTTPWQGQYGSGQLDLGSSMTLFWHFLGCIGLILFNSRFWVQWWQAERSKKSFLGKSFWWMSLVGESLCFLYFFKIQDPVNFIGPAFGLIPYIRNLVLISRQEVQAFR